MQPTAMISGEMLSMQLTDKSGGPGDLVFTLTSTGISDLNEEARK